MAYEGLLVSGVVMTVSLAYALITQQRHALVGTAGLRLVVFVTLGVYFVGFWASRGQTLAMQTWRIRLVTREGRPPGVALALCRYVLAWMWLAPALGALSLSGLKGAVPVASVLGLGVLAYAGLSRLQVQRQYWHDAVCGTRLIAWPPESVLPAHERP